MGNVIIKGTTKKVFVSATNYYGANLTVDVFDDDANTFLANAVPMTELVEPVTTATATTTVDIVSGDKVITVDDVSGVAVTDRIQLGSDVYKIIAKDVSVNTLTLHRAIDANVVTGATVTKVGNMGIFKINLFITKNGYFVIQAKDTKFGIHKSDSITVKDQSLEELFDITNKEINQNERVIRETSSFTILI